MAQRKFLRIRSHLKLHFKKIISPSHTQRNINCFNSAIVCSVFRFHLTTSVKFVELFTLYVFLNVKFYYCALFSILNSKGILMCKTNFNLNNSNVFKSSRNLCVCASLTLLATCTCLMLSLKSPTFPLSNSHVEF